MAFFIGYFTAMKSDRFEVIIAEPKICFNNFQSFDMLIFVSISGND